MQQIRFFALKTPKFALNIVTWINLLREKPTNIENTQKSLVLLGEIARKIEEIIPGVSGEKNYFEQYKML